MITIQELLYNRGLDRAAKIKLVRHKDRRLNLHKLYRENREDFLDYQNTQKKPVFNDCQYIVSFVGEDGLTARFIGVFEIMSVHEIKRGNNEKVYYKYAMQEVDGFSDLKERVIIRWCNGISWHQWIKNEMEVLEVAQGLRYKRFTDYFDLILEYDELQEIIECQYPDWKQVLSAIKGIYLITDTNTGKLYVGSAYGNDGIWGRWGEYVTTNGSGGNKSLKALVEKDKEYAHKYFQFSILMLLPKTVTQEEAIYKEQLFKKKLGSNSYGLNNN